MKSIVEKILSDARNEVETIKKRYDAEINNLKQEYETKIALAEKSLKEEIEKKKQEEIARALARLKLEYNKKLTTQMQSYIDEILKSAIKKLPEHKKYFDFLKTLIKNSGVKEGELYLSTSDIKRYKLQLEKFLKQENCNFTIKSEDNMLGGVIIRKGNTTFLGSIDVIVEINRDDLKNIIARTLEYI
ncbi:MAG: V-type ATP synthase subunit E [candidate division WOR-3 bacterium]|nr:V-type ATP synthase subunit E [candidate division WOR-3 bacterium]